MQSSMPFQVEPLTTSHDELITADLVAQKTAPLADAAFTGNPQPEHSSVSILDLYVAYADHTGEVSAAISVKFTGDKTTPDSFSPWKDRKSVV